MYTTTSLIVDSTAFLCASCGAERSCGMGFPLLVIGLADCSFRQHPHSWRYICLNIGRLFGDLIGHYIGPGDGASVEARRAMARLTNCSIVTPGRW